MKCRTVAGRGGPNGRRKVMMGVAAAILPEAEARECDAVVIVAKERLVVALSRDWSAAQLCLGELFARARTSTKATT